MKNKKIQFAFLAVVKKFIVVILIITPIIISVKLSNNNLEKMIEKKDNTEKVSEKKKPVAELNNFIETESGLLYKVVKEGQGENPKVTDTVTVHYEGKLEDGSIFDSSYLRKQPAEFPLESLITGWKEGIVLMKKGAEFIFIIPYHLAYGENGIPGAIPPKSTLIFKVELLDFKSTN